MEIKSLRCWAGVVLRVSQRRDYLSAPLASSSFTSVVLPHTLVHVNIHFGIQQRLNHTCPFYPAQAL